ncbi:tRNA pseudouridine(55) synthase TruB [bacterium]|nr:tRNA pseudouridine(55) synthase TruB [bacterium]
MFGFLNVYKPKGITSHDVVAVLRRVTGVKQIGHTGTLDPFAEGVLPVCIGKATRLIEYLNDEKAYIGTLKLGASTTTYDIEGDVSKTSDKKVTLDEIKDVLDNFKGEIEQFPPMYSAIKVNGKKLYEYARQGEDVEIKPRKVTVNEIKILNFDAEKQEIEIYIKCSKGTYIRSIANDLGQKLGTYAYLIKLIRVQAGDFLVQNSVQLENLKTLEDVHNNLIHPLDYLNYPKYSINDEEKNRISNGNSIRVTYPNGIILLTENAKIAAVAEVQNSVAKCKKVFI